MGQFVQKPLISIIVPVYNGAKHIAKCYASLCKQTLDNWQAIFINDGSQDESLSILQDLQTKDTRLRIIDKNNEGVAVARQTGLKYADSVYITFLDVDDTLPVTALENFINGFDNQDVGVVAGGLSLVNPSGAILNRIQYSNCIYNRAEELARLCDGRIRWQLWGKAFRKELFEGVLTPEGIRCGEDMAVCIQLCSNAKKLRTISGLVYDYVQIPTSVTHANAKKIAVDSLKASQFVNKFLYNKIDKTDLDCIYLLNASAALRSGISLGHELLQTVFQSHFSINAVMRLPLHKAVNLIIAKYLNINLARFI